MRYPVQPGTAKYRRRPAGLCRLQSPSRKLHVPEKAMRRPVKAWRSCNSATERACASCEAPGLPRSSPWRSGSVRVIPNERLTQIVQYDNQMKVRR
jgi:hypothetical protein